VILMRAAPVVPRRRHRRHPAARDYHELPPVSSVIVTPMTFLSAGLRPLGGGMFPSLSGEVVAVIIEVAGWRTWVGRGGDRAMRVRA
jgi:hypothetical protein